IPPEAEVLIKSKEEMSDYVGFKVHRGYFAMGLIPEPIPFRDGLVIALDGISHAENVGSILRNCAGFGVGGVIIGETTANPWLRRSVRVAMGAPLRTPLKFTDNLAETISQMSIPTYAAHIHGEKMNLDEIDLSQDTCIVLGSEADGVSPSVLNACDRTVYIPMSADWDCINVAASSAVFLYAATRQRKVMTHDS
ncbi:MAG: RNA methyltransferase, partial [Planctomycetota bacterium]|nr:RNA methyltransferase [Planctomycetota bacterium]